MRNLTIKRTKSFVGSVVKMKIYVEDPASQEITINNIPCRKIGEIKNGEVQTFQVGEHALKVFVIADKLSKDYCNEYYQLPEGEEDVFLTGRNRFNPANGNAFRFDNNNNEAASANRKRGTRTGLIVLVVAVIVGAVAGYFISRGILSGGAPKEKTFSSNGLSITLTDEFVQTEAENFTGAYDSENVAVLALQEPFTLAEGFGDITLDEYADLVLIANGLDGTEKAYDDGLIEFEYGYTDPKTGESYQYSSYVYKTDDAFWTIQFATSKDNVEKYSMDIPKWADSVTFSE